MDQQKSLLLMSFRSFVRGIAGVIGNVSRTQQNSGILIHLLSKNMSGKEENNGEIEGTGSEIGGKRKG